MTSFHVRVDDGPEQTITVATSVYMVAALAVPALLADVDTPCIVEIWVPDLLPDYGPYLYRIRNDDFGRILIENVVRDDQQAAPPSDEALPTAEDVRGILKPE
jgi:hypothetical protein